MKSINYRKRKWYLKLTWAKTDDILDSIPFEVIENCSIRSARYVFVWACMVRAQIRGWGSDYGNASIRALIASLIFFYGVCPFFQCFYPNFLFFFLRYSANLFSVTFSFFFKKYISFVLSQYKNKAHCTYCSIGKFFCLFKWLLLLLKQCSTVSCHGPWLSTVH